MPTIDLTDAEHAAVSWPSLIPLRQRSCSRTRRRRPKPKTTSGAGSVGAINLLFEKQHGPSRGMGGPRTKSSGRSSSLLRPELQRGPRSPHVEAVGRVSALTKSIIAGSDEHALIQIKWREPARERKVNARQPSLASISTSREGDRGVRGSGGPARQSTRACVWAISAALTSRAIDATRATRMSLSGHSLQLRALCGRASFGLAALH
jgi:hypothetical protein